MSKNSNGGIKAVLVILLTGILVAPFISSCGKSGTKNAASFNIQYEVINVSPSLGPVSLYIDYNIYNNYNFFYAVPSGYFNLTSIDTPFQIRSSPNQLTNTGAIQGNILVRDDKLVPNCKYTLFMTGLKSNNTISDVFLTDTSAPPSLGRAKVRFLNASPQSPGFDIVANGYLDPGFTNLTYQKVSKYIEMPAGNYNFQVFQTGTNTGVIGTLPNVTVQDGHLYTLYSYGLVGHTDSLAFAMGAITNK